MVNIWLNVLNGNFGNAKLPFFSIENEKFAVTKSNMFRYHGDLEMQAWQACSWGAEFPSLIK